MSSIPPAIVLTDLSFAWPDGQIVFDSLTGTVGAGRSGLIGANGTGKSTLLRLIAGDLTPTSGTVRVDGGVGHLRQDLTLSATMRVDEVLGVARAHRALRALESGVTDDATLAAIGDRWDVTERARATLDRLGLTHVDLDRPVGRISGGEAVLLGLAAQFLRRPAVLLLDEPTNNLDLDARERLYDAVEAYPGVLVVVSHDRELLDRVDQIGDLRAGGIRWYGGNLSGYEEAVAVEQEAAQRLYRMAESHVRRQERELVDARVRLARRQRYAQKMWDTKREPKSIMGNRRSAAQVSAGKYHSMHQGKLAEARGRLDAAEEAVHDDPAVRIHLPATTVPAGREVLALRGVRLRSGNVVDLDVRGPERIAVVGPNGAGKTTLLQTIVGDVAARAGTVAVHVPVGYLPQRLDILDDDLSVAGNVARSAPRASHNAVRAGLARFLFRGARAEQPAGQLSGGERFRASLAALLLADPAPQLLLLDEPTNNLDLATVAQLTAALSGYRGALLVASHDRPFLHDLGITRWIEVGR
ncbi:ABC-F family ATP-binding cassette domain-containing protein [Virgisporangium aurantiacum]|uniref:ABC transporter n=1 Tax=Virgisporangium aurantiacum TaxID=175570 RepID=A0A8J3ZAW1_9ACTN|nr:ABC-F family ATP-binding cassette domain-containing protein [Virgisporangium aurantiacum]GIJ59508.1 ABC transporter [Virgisporangium aurantiacum]